MQRRIGLLCLIVCLFALDSTGYAQTKMPDLISVVVDANQGYIEVRNIGNTKAEPSQLYVNCSVIHSGKSSTSCASGLHLPGFIAKWNILSYDIPALQPGSKYPLHLFGSGSFPRKPGVYAMAITSDPLKRIVESDETNNITHLGTVIKVEAPSVSGVSAQSADLVPVIINPDQGIVQVRNQGTLAANASRLATTCKRYNPQGRFIRNCTARTYLPNFDASRSLLYFNIPPLRPGESHEIHLFGRDAWPQLPSGSYQFELRADLDHEIAETNVNNNSTSFTSFRALNAQAAQDNLPDLIAVASDPFFGIVYIENQGEAAAGASKALLTCKQVAQSGACPASPAMERLYDPKLGGFVVEVPPLPAGKVHRVIFPMSGFAWEKGEYTFSLTADAKRAVAEAREDNNTVHRTLPWATGGLRLTATSSGKPAAISYRVGPTGDRSHLAGYGYQIRKNGQKIATPVDLSLPTGTYQLAIQPANSQGSEQHFDIEIEAGEIIEQKIAFQQPGLLNITTQDAHSKPLSRVFYSINLSAGKEKQYSTVSVGGGASAFKVSLLPGRYDLHVYRKLSAHNESKDSTVDINRIMGADEEQVIRGIRIQSGMTVDQRIVFKYIEPGILNFQVLCDGKPARSYINFSSVEKDAPTLFSFDTPKQLKLAPGRYKLTVHPADARNGGAFQNFGYGSKSVEIAIHAGETLDKQLRFTKAKKGRLALTVKVDGSRKKAEIGIRRAGTKGGFSTVTASYNMLNNETDLLPGVYDFSISPLEQTLSPGGISTYHRAGWEAPSIVSHKMTGVDPIILHGIQIKAGETLDKTLSFETKHE